MSSTNTLSEILINGQPVTVDQIVFFGKTEDHWTKPYVRKRHHEPETRSVILRGRIIETRGQQFKVRLEDNNGFEKDGQIFVFEAGCLLSDQNFRNIDQLGQWKQNPTSNP